MIDDDKAGETEIIGGESMNDGDARKMRQNRRMLVADKMTKKV